MRTAICLLLPLLLAGCVMTSNEREGLPTGVTLLESDQGLCDGPIEIEGDPDVEIDQGESTTIAVDDDEDIEWDCLAGSTPDEGEFNCPSGTSYVRITREEDAEEFTLECYGA